MKRSPRPSWKLSKASVGPFYASRRAWVRCWKPPPTSRHRMEDGPPARLGYGLTGETPVLHPTLQASSGDAARLRRRCSLQRAHQEFGVIGDDSVHSPVSQATHVFFVIHRPHKNSAAASLNVLNQRTAHQRLVRHHAVKRKVTPPGKLGGSLTDES